METGGHLITEYFWAGLDCLLPLVLREKEERRWIDFHSTFNQTRYDFGRYKDTDDVELKEGYPLV